MKKILLITAFGAAFSAAFLASCDNVDGTSVVPVFDAIQSSNDRPAPGDSVNFTAHQAVMGKLINATTYTWSFRYSYFKEEAMTADTVVVKSVQTNYDGIDSSDPKMGFRLPQDIAGASFTVTIHASYSLSGQTAEGAIYGQATRTRNFNINYD